MNLFNWISLGLAPATGIVTWIAARRARNNSTLQSMQDSIDKLYARNSELYDEVLKLRTENSKLQEEILSLKSMMDKYSKK